MVSNPEFLKEGAALDDFMRPDRVVIGVRNARPVEIMRELYTPFLRVEQPFLVMSPESAETTSTLPTSCWPRRSALSTKSPIFASISKPISTTFAAALATIAASGLPSCFPASAMAAVAFLKTSGLCNTRLAPGSRAADAGSRRSRQHQAKDHPAGEDPGALRRATGRANSGRLGSGFQAATDDIREATALALIDRLLEMGVHFQVHHPKALDNVRAQYGHRLTYAERPYDALSGVEAVVIMTEWKEFQNPDFKMMRKRMKAPVIFDGRNIFDPAHIRAAGFTYHSIGRMSVRPQ